MTIAEYLTYWLMNVAKGKVSKTTYVNYESLVLRTGQGQKAAGAQAALLTGRRLVPTGRGQVRASSSARNKGTPIEPRNLNRSFETLCARAGVRKVGFRDLRHTCASPLHEQSRRRPHDHRGARGEWDASLIRSDKSRRPCGSLHRASDMLRTRKDSNLQPSDP
ncbi:hypothetical protein SSP24_64050 [Streptomyces spinoverrucosus]|uniref:Tyr recombinase domain-containing protein n=1 Tax=Streptomyces spinoverrucosus TaxID=284043 RepID=A0A4Y3VSX4_9ACTN|nr:hypothetical protein [Streptomyces spinoverrucosus]GEC08750.1 hypothetical protein SSP24_64050 [Streptomyces spinoverrucosus]GHB64080.1 hypothetical protein GCM10010397_37760 [Streptomyces spinoverrucosus]